MRSISRWCFAPVRCRLQRAFFEVEGDACRAVELADQPGFEVKEGATALRRRPGELQIQIVASPRNHNHVVLNHCGRPCVRTLVLACLTAVLAARCASSERGATHESASIDALLTDCEVRRHRPCSTSRSRRGSKASGGLAGARERRAVRRTISLIGRRASSRVPAPNSP